MRGVKASRVAAILSRGHREEYFCHGWTQPSPERYGGQAPTPRATKNRAGKKLSQSLRGHREECFFTPMLTPEFAPANTPEGFCRSLLWQKVLSDSVPS
jgi:hypothetical protein